MTGPDRDDLNQLLEDLQDMSSETPEVETPGALADSLSALSLALPRVAPTADLRARLLATAARPEHRWAPFTARLARLIDVAHDRARELLAAIVRPDPWQRLLPGVDLLHLQGGPAVAGADVGFVRVAAGGAFPEHRHLGPERVLILQGGYVDDQGQTARAGDLVELPAGSSHSFVALPGDDLIYAVVVGGVEFPGLDPAVTAAVATADPADI